MNKSRTLLLNHQQITQRINRIAWQIYEDNSEETEIFIIGIKQNGYVLAQKIQKAVQHICELNVHLLELHIDKQHQEEHQVTISGSPNIIVGKSIVLVDD